MPEQEAPTPGKARKRSIRKGLILPVEAGTARPPATMERDGEQRRRRWTSIDRGCSPWESLAEADWWRSFSGRGLGDLSASEQVYLAGWWIAWPARWAAAKWHATDGRTAAIVDGVDGVMLVRPETFTVRAAAVAQALQLWAAQAGRDWRAIKAAHSAAELHRDKIARHESERRGSDLGWIEDARAVAQALGHDDATALRAGWAVAEDMAMAWMAEGAKSAAAVKVKGKAAMQTCVDVLRTRYPRWMTAEQVRHQTDYKSTDYVRRVLRLAVKAGMVESGSKGYRFKPPEGA